MNRIVVAKSEAPRRIGLVGCVKRKAQSARAARDLYISPLFQGRRTYVEHSCDEWWILSALHGLVYPDDVLEPYDVTMRDSTFAQRRKWSAAVLSDIDVRVQPRCGDTFEMHAGTDYRLFGLEDGLRERGFSIANPTEGLKLGPQLSFYSESQWT